MRIRNFLMVLTIAILVFLVFLFYSCSPTELDEPEKPNILVIMADDAGFADFGFQDETMKKITPHLDQLAEQGIVFERAYTTASVCGPSRAGFLSGIYQQRVGFQKNFPAHWSNPPHPSWSDDTWRNFGLDTTVSTMADYLKDAGYRTGIIGKWHLGYDEKYYPTARGFDYFWGFRSGSRSYFSNPEYKSMDIPFYYHGLEENGERISESKVSYLTDDLTEVGLGFIEKSTSHQEPFFLFMSYNAPHTPMQATEEDLALVEEWFPEAEQRRRTYMAMLYRLDLGVGRLLDFLKKQGELENTMVVFLSDNGGSKKNASSNLPLRGWKWSPYEGGTHVPMVISWPEALPGGSTKTDVVSVLDLMPTFLDAAGFPIPEHLDGTTLIPFLDGRMENMPERSLFWREYVLGRDTEWMLSPDLMKAIWFGESSSRSAQQNPDHPSLFDLKEDPFEQNNLGEEKFDQVKDMRARYNEWAEGMESPRW